MWARSAQRSTPKFLKMLATAFVISVILRESREFGVLKSMIARKRGGFLGGPIKVMDILDHQCHCTWNIIPTRGNGLRHVVVHKLLHQAFAN